MTRDEFMKELAYLLQDIQDDDRDDAFQYYTDYFDEAGPDKESEIIRELGSPERVAAIIRADIAGHLKEGGEFTEQGYGDERFRDPGYGMEKRLDLPQERESAPQDRDFHQESQKSSTHRKDSGSRPNPPRSSVVIKLILWAVLIIVAFPILAGIGGGMLGIGGGLLGLAVGALMLLPVLLAVLGIITLGILLGGIVMVPYGLIHMFAQPLNGLMTAGTGFIFLGAGALCLALSVLFYGRFLPFIIRSIVNGLSRILHRGR